MSRWLRSWPSRHSAEAEGEGLRYRLLILGFWTLLGLLESSKAYVSTHLRGEGRTWATVLVGNMPWWIIWALLTPVVFWLAARFRLDRPGWRWAVGVHFLASIVLSTVHLAGAGVLYYLTHTRGIFFDSPGEQVRMFVDGYIVVDMLTYWVALGGYHAIEYYRRYRQGELLAAQLETRAAQLETSMTEARLQALRMELNPHFLFNTLNAIAGLVRRRENADAVRMIARLGDLLRATLVAEERTEVPLTRELEVLRHYLDLEGVRFRDRLAVDVSVDPAVESALIPPLLLQPLVENAVRHGTARTPGAGRIEVRASARDGRLEVTIEDTGPGFREGPPREGVGLANTRARLAQLYGEEGRLELGAAAGGGGRVRVSLPLREASPDRVAERQVLEAV